MRQLLGGLGAFLLIAALAGSSRADEADEKVLREAGIATDGPGLLTFFKNRTVDDTGEARLKALVRQLGDDDFAVREQATRQLVAIGPRARPALKEALKSSDPEVSRRAREVIQHIEQGASAAVIASAVRVLAQRKPAGAAEALLGYLPSSEDDLVTQEVRGALEELALRDGKVEPVLLAALTDANPLKRGAAGVAVARAKVAAHMEAARKLLADPEPRVRLRVGLALAAAREKDAVPVLIRLLDQLPSEETGNVEDLLIRVAGDKAPSELPGSDEPSRRSYREAWEKWWKDNEARVDAADLEKAGRTLGYTLVVLLDQNTVMDLDAANRPRWKISGLGFPLDAQLLVGEQRVLVAEHEAGRVSERDLEGKVKWEYKIEQPMVAQRLPNGNTFIAARHRLVEVDKDGKEVFSYTRPDGAFFMKAAKLRNGDIACVTQLGVARFVRLTPTGDGKEFREAKSFGVDVRTSGGRIEVLPNGHVLVPEMHNNRVVEYDSSGKVIREMEVEHPIAAVRLPNGHTLVTLMTQHRAVELDRTGKEVWQYKADTRVTRAFRR